MKHETLEVMALRLGISLPWVEVGVGVVPPGRVRGSPAPSRAHGAGRPRHCKHPDRREVTQTKGGKVYKVMKCRVCDTNYERERYWRARA